MHQKRVHWWNEMRNAIRYQSRQIYGFSVFEYWLWKKVDESGFYPLLLHVRDTTKKVHYLVFWGFFRFLHTFVLNQLPPPSETKICLMLFRQLITSTTLFQSELFFSSASKACGKTTKHQIIRDLHSDPDKCSESHWRVLILRLCWMNNVYFRQPVSVDSSELKCWAFIKLKERTFKNWDRKSSHPAPCQFKRFFFFWGLLRLYTPTCGLD